MKMNFLINVYNKHNNENAVCMKKILRTKVNNDFNVKTIMMKICGKLSDECVFFFLHIVI